MIEALFEIIGMHFDIVTGVEHVCSTHVHVSPQDNFNIAQVRKMAKGVTLFQRTMALLLPRPARLLAALPSRPVS